MTVRVAEVKGPEVSHPNVLQVSHPNERQSWHYRLSDSRTQSSKALHLTPSEGLSQAKGKQVRNGTMYQEGGRVEFKPEFKVLQGAQKD